MSGFSLTLKWWTIFSLTSCNRNGFGKSEGAYKDLELPPGALGTWEAISVANPAAVGGPPLRS